MYIINSYNIHWKLATIVCVSVVCAYLYIISSLSLFKVGGGIGVRGTTEGEGEFRMYSSGGENNIRRLYRRR